MLELALTDVKPISPVVFVLCQPTPHLALRVLLSPRERIEVRASVLDSLTSYSNAGDCAVLAAN
jgi:hypothetical protein